MLVAAGAGDVPGVGACDVGAGAGGASSAAEKAERAAENGPGRARAGDGVAATGGGAIGVGATPADADDAPAIIGLSEERTDATTMMTRSDTASSAAAAIHAQSGTRRRNFAAVIVRCSARDGGANRRCTSTAACERADASGSGNSFERLPECCITGAGSDGASTAVFKSSDSERSDICGTTTGGSAIGAGARGGTVRGGAENACGGCVAFARAGGGAPAAGSGAAGRRRSAISGRVEVTIVSSVSSKSSRGGS